MYHPSTTSLTHDMTTLATSSNFIPHPSTFTSNPFFNPNSPIVPPSPTSRYTFANLNVSSPSIPLDLQRWNYQRFLSSNFKTDSTMSDHHSRNGSFHRYSSRPPTKSSYSTNDNDLLLNKFYHDTLVHLENNETKNIQHLTSNDFLVSAKQSSQYSSLLARIDYIGPVDPKTGKVELRFYLTEVDRSISYSAPIEMPFFVQQYSGWSSISPDYTHRRCGLACRQLVCGDIILAINEQTSVRSRNNLEKPDYRQQSPTKSLVDRYLTRESGSASKRPRVSNQ